MSKPGSGGKPGGKTGLGDRKARVNTLLNDLLKMGTVKGFKYFRFHLRGREELIVTIMNAPRSITPLRSPASSHGNSDFGRLLLPRNVNSLLLSSRTQRRLSGYGYMNVGLPPASPSETESLQSDEDSTMFLIAGYARYQCPYVWVRSNHERLMRDSDGADARDSPLKLKSTSAWAQEDIRLWDMLEELVNINTHPSPRNPLKVDRDYFRLLDGVEAVLGTSAMINCLQRVLDSSRDTGHDDLIVDDIRELTVIHLKAVHQLSQDRGWHDDDGEEDV